MMGNECIIELWSQYANNDDLVGGPEITGSYVTSVRGRIEAATVEMQILNQGIETGQLYMCTLDTHTLTVRNNWLIRVNWPLQHFLYNVWLKVITVVRTSGLDSRAHIELFVRDVDESH